ncbi:hypothetical protein ACFP3Q_11380 [Nocardioides sp. GCM10027113]|uniref:hypothetical protein n=1 Tax=unclassified Nocardioides TaxID=2615069 RepID=UPI00361DE3EA
MELHGLRAEAQSFADRLSELFNGTVCNGPPIAAVAWTSKETGHRAVVGYGVGKQILSASPLPLANCRSKVPLYAVMSYTLVPDDYGEFAMVLSSTLGLCLDADGKQGLFHADYERNKGAGYPEAHLQVYATSPSWESVLQDSPDPRPLNKLHLPSGGRRYRPTAEDLIDFLVAERLVEPRAGWEAVVQRHRDDFEERQLRAAVRHRPEVARDALERYGQE